MPVVGANHVRLSVAWSVAHQADTLRSSLDLASYLFGLLSQLLSNLFLVRCEC